MSSAHRGISLLPREALVRTGPVDHADWNYRPILGQVQRLRFGLVHSLLGSTHYQRLLEIGYGVSSYCVEGDRLHFLDVQTITNMGSVTMRTRSDQVATRSTTEP